MARRTDGFTLLELTIVIMVGAILATIAMNGYALVQSRLAVGGARDTFASLHSRARAYAVERGVLTRFNVDASGDSVWITSGGTRVDGLNFRSSMGVDIQSGTSSLTLCMTPRGFADTGCNTFGSTVDFTFAQGAESTTLSLRTLGQLVY
ncbi:MAG: prepilin-type N-terminal cleavage/methylation domain-containing protein [Gemmatimonadetes bacterium]|nr:prepilin-type N-terminal cleavage/methylation domain-containing protein [Gemmatimonadota bacterium]